MDAELLGNGMWQVTCTAKSELYCPGKAVGHLVEHLGTLEAWSWETQKQIVLPISPKGGPAGRYPGRPCRVAIGLPRRKLALEIRWVNASCSSPSSFLINHGVASCSDSNWVVISVRASTVIGLIRNPSRTPSTSE